MENAPKEPDGVTPSQGERINYPPVRLQVGLVVLLIFTALSPAVFLVSYGILHRETKVIPMILAYIGLLLVVAGYTLDIFRPAKPECSKQFSVDLFLPSNQKFAVTINLAWTPKKQDKKPHPITPERLEAVARNSVVMYSQGAASLDLKELETSLRSVLAAQEKELELLKTWVNVVDLKEITPSPTTPSIIIGEQ